MANLGYHEARLVVNQMIKTRLDSMITDVLVEIGQDRARTFKDRLEMIEAVPSIYGDLIQKLDWNMEYHQEAIERRNRIEEYGPSDEDVEESQK